MSATSSMTAWIEQDPMAQAREQIREQVRRDVERALEDARRARAEGRVEARIQGRGEEGQLVVPVPPLPPGQIITGPNGERVTITSTGQPSMPFPSDIPQRAQELGFAFLFTLAAIFIGTPLARAFGRRLDRKTVAPAATPEVVTRLDRIEQAVEAIAIEVERISEGQRYVTKVMSDPRALPSPNEAAAHEVRMAERGAAERAAAERGR